jgi:hypothetical protein
LSPNPLNYPDPPNPPGGRKPGRIGGDDIPPSNKKVVSYVRDDKNKFLESDDSENQLTKKFQKVKPTKLNFEDSDLEIEHKSQNHELEDISQTSEQGSGAAPFGCISGGLSSRFGIFSYSGFKNWLIKWDENIKFEVSEFPEEQNACLASKMMQLTASFVFKNSPVLIVGIVVGVAIWVVYQPFKKSTN